MSELAATHSQRSAGPTLLVVPFANTIGAEVRGLDVARGVDAPGFELVRKALDDYSVVVLRDQDLSPADQVSFSRGLGELQPLFYSRYCVPNYPDVTRISNIKENGEAIGISDAGMLWHTDGSYNARPDMYTLLYGIQIPQRDGDPIGDTAFSSVTKAFLDLPEELRRQLTTLRCTHSFVHHLEKKAAKGLLSRAPLTPEQEAQLPDVEHPVVRRHPRTGLPCLYVSEGHTKSINGVPAADSDALLQQLWHHLKQPRFQYRHKWRKGDLLIWDNCAVQHLAIFDYGDLPRRLHRCATRGEAPVAWQPY